MAGDVLHGKVTSSSQFGVWIEFLNQLKGCLELRLDFPFDLCLLGLIDYSETLEESKMDS
jgi:predicted RNA-binding protein with RPS1 domain